MYNMISFKSIQFKKLFMRHAQCGIAEDCPSARTVRRPSVSTEETTAATSLVKVRLVFVFASLQPDMQIFICSLLCSVFENT